MRACNSKIRQVGNNECGRPEKALMVSDFQSVHE